MCLVHGIDAVGEVKERCEEEVEEDTERKKGASSSKEKRCAYCLVAVPEVKAIEENGTYSLYAEQAGEGDHPEGKK